MTTFSKMCKVTKFQKIPQFVQNDTVFFAVFYPIGEMEKFKCFVTCEFAQNSYLKLCKSTEMYES